MEKENRTWSEWFTGLFHTDKSYVQIIEEIERNSKIIFLVMALVIEFIFLNALAVKLSFSYSLLLDKDISHQSVLTYAFAYGIELTAFLLAILQAFNAKRRSDDEIKKKQRKEGWGASFERFGSWLSQNIFLVVFVGVSAWGMFVSGMWTYKTNEATSNKFLKITDVIKTNPLEDTLTIDPLHFATIIFMVVGLSFAVLALTHVIAKLFFEVIEEKREIIKEEKKEGRKEATTSKRSVKNKPTRKPPVKKVEPEPVIEEEPLVEVERPQRPVRQTEKIVNQEPEYDAFNPPNSMKLGKGD